MRRQSRRAERYDGAERTPYVPVVSLLVTALGSRHRLSPLAAGEEREEKKSTPKRPDARAAERAADFSGNWTRPGSRIFATFNESERHEKQGRADPAVYGLGARSSGTTTTRLRRRYAGRGSLWVVRILSPHRAAPRTRLHASVRAAHHVPNGDTEGLRTQGWPPRLVTPRPLGRRKLVIES